MNPLAGRSAISHDKQRRIPDEVSSAGLETGFHAQEDPAGCIAPGTTVGFNYELIEQVASGGMGFIYRAIQHPSGRQVAVKVMRSALLRDKTAVKRFEIEASAAARLNHRSCVTLFDFGESDGMLFMAMEWLEGPNLSSLLKQHGPMSAIRVARVGAAVASALAEAHHKGIIHRDLKPENVVLTKGDESSPYHVKVLDFGIAKMASGDAQTQLTQLGHVCGTPEYMSPEQARGDVLDGRSDIYSLGCMLYSLLTGSVPFPGDSVMRIVFRHITEPLPALPQGTPEALARIIQRAASKEPEQRFPDAHALFESLEQFVAGSGLSETDDYLQAEVKTGNEGFFTEVSMPSAIYDVVDADVETEVIEEDGFEADVTSVSPQGLMPAAANLAAAPAVASPPTSPHFDTVGAAEPRRWLLPGILAMIIVVLAVVIGLLLR